MRRFHLLLSVAFLTLLLAACNNASAADPASYPDLVIRVKQTGVYEIALRDLKRFGWHGDPTRVQDKRLALFQGEEEIPFQLVGAKGKRRLRFFAQVSPTRFDDRGAYILRLTKDTSRSLTLESRSTTRPNASLATSFVSTIRQEKNTTYLAQVRDGDPWVGERLFAPGEVRLDIDTPSPVDGSGLMRIKVWAATTAPGDIDHRLVFTLNGRSLGGEAWDGNGPREIELAIPPGALQPNGNELVIIAPGDTGAAADLVYLNWVEITYDRKLEAQENHLLFSTDANAIAVSGLHGTRAEVWDVSKPTRPVRLEIQPSNEEQIKFTATGSGQRTYIAFSEQGLLQPDEINEAPRSLIPPEQGADYIIIAHPSLAEAMQPLATYRERQGLRTVIVTTDQIYLRFNGGMQSPNAITEFLRWAVETWPKPAPRYVLLAGDASYDPLNYLDAPYKNLVPGKFVSTIEMGETISDNAMADINGDGWQDLAIGRFPAQTPEQIRAMVDKTIAFETARPPGEWIDQMLFVADDDDLYFNVFNEEHIALVPSAFATENLVIAPGQDTRAKLLERINQGRGLISYMGHGAIDIWAQEEILKNNDVPAFQQDGRLGIFLVWACLNGYFQHPSQLSLGEVLLITPEKGAVAGLFPTGQTFPNDQWVMADALFQNALFEQPTIGEALFEAARALNPEDSGQRDIINTFLLLGDPALRLPWNSPQP